MMPARWIGLILLGLLALGAAPPGAPSTAPSDREARLQERRAARLKEEAEALFRTADTTFLVGDLARALELFERCAALAPNSPLVVRAHARMGDCAYELKRYDDAGKHYRRASSLAEKAAIADEVAAGVRSDYMIGQTHLVARQYAQAFSAFRRFIDRHPGHPLVNKAYQSIGDGHMAMEQYQQALEAYRMVGTVIAKKSAAHKRITPGSRLYLRVDDADVNVGETPRTVAARLTVRSGDVETVELQPLGAKSPLFIGTIATALGPPRDSGVFGRIFTESDAAAVRGSIERAERAEAESRDAAAEAHALERSPLMQADPANTERRRRECVERSERLAEEARRLRAEACARVDRGFAQAEKLLAEWAPSQSLDAIGKATTLPSEPQRRAAPAAEAADRSRRAAPEFDPSMGQPLALDPGSEPVRGLTQSDVDRARLDAALNPTTLDNLNRRVGLLVAWMRLLERQFQRLEVLGDDVIEVAYIDEIGPGGRNDPKRGLRTDRIEIASDAMLRILTADAKHAAVEAVLNSEIVIRVMDLDRDVSTQADSLRAVVAVLPPVDKQAAELRALTLADPATKPATRRATPGEPDETDASTRPAGILPLVPDGMPHLELTLMETGPHTGIFETRVRLGDSAIEWGGGKLPVIAGNELRFAYRDARAIRNPDGFVYAVTVEVVAGGGGHLAAVQYRNTPLDLEAKLGRAIAAGEIGRIYVDLGLHRRGRQYLAAAQADCLEVADRAGVGGLGEQALYHSWRIYFYAGLLDDSVAAARTLIARYPDSEYVDDALFAIGQASLRQGQREAEKARAAGQRAGANRDLQRAIGQLEDLARRSPQSPLAPEALYLVGQAHIAAGQTGIEVFERLAKLYPDSGFAPRGMLQAAEYYLGIADFRRAQEYYTKLLIDYPDSPQLGQALFSRAKCQFKLGQTQAAMQSLYRVVEEHAGTDLAQEAQRMINHINQKRSEDANE